ncbi:MAG TPA: MmgE/PrpD family protein [Oceanospirillaceae bacterium]|nr:MmgE/PrpD family protein [Oceanospirillaceae bacterium]
MVNSHPLRQFLQILEFDQLPPAVITQAKVCLYDLLGTAVGGARSATASIITKHAQDHFAAGVSITAVQPLLGGPAMSPVGAALVGATMIDALDCHDGQRDTKGHVGCSMLPSLVAVLESQGHSVTGKRLISLIVAGYEIGTRAGMALHGTVTDYHTSGAWGAVNCAAITAHILGLTDAKFDHAVGIAEYHGPRSQMMRNIDHPTMLKDGSGWGAMAGTSAAYLAAEGFTGAPAITITGDDAMGYWQDLGQQWQILNQYFKPYPVCRWAQPAVAACLSLRQQHQFDPSQVEQITVSTFHQGVRLFSEVPKDTEQAQYAISFPVAMAVLNGVISTDDVYSGFEDAQVQSMISKVKLVEDTSYNAVFPAERWAHVSIRMANGTQISSEPHEALGDPHKPMSPTQFHDKYMSLCEPVWGANKAQQVLDYIEHLEQGNLADLLALIRG